MKLIRLKEILADLANEIKSLETQQAQANEQAHELPARPTLQFPTQTPAPAPASTPAPIPTPTPTPTPSPTQPDPIQTPAPSNPEAANMLANFYIGDYLNRGVVNIPQQDRDTVVNNLSQALAGVCANAVVGATDLPGAFGGTDGVNAVIAQARPIVENMFNTQFPAYIQSI